MEISLLKISTKELKTVQTDCSVWWWAEGNGGCDCNRRIEFEGKLNEDDSCSSCEYLIYDWSGEDKPTDIYYMNSYYPKELIDKYIQAKGCLYT